jgi:hypothetical protein
MVEDKFLICSKEIWFVVRGGGDVCPTPGEIVTGKKKDDVCPTPGLIITAGKKEGGEVDLAWYYEKARSEGDFDVKVKFPEGLKVFENGGAVDFVDDKLLGGKLGEIGLVNRETVVRYCKEQIYKKRVASNSTSIIVTVLFIDLGSGESFFVV